MGSGYIVQRGGESKPSGTISITENETVAKLVDKFDLAKDVAEKYLGKYLKK